MSILLDHETRVMVQGITGGQARTHLRYMLDYGIAFLSDCSGCTSEEDHEATLRNISHHFGRVLTSDEVIAAWRHR